MILLDTHVVLWLYAREPLPAAVERRLNDEQLGLSPFAQLEMAYLYEIGRIRRSAQVVIE
jgi:PIN domain nuclease of toxin-antitoxin system